MAFRNTLAINAREVLHGDMLPREVLIGKQSIKGEGALESMAVPLNGGLLLAIFFGIPIALAVYYATPAFFPTLADHDEAISTLGATYLQIRLLAVPAVGSRARITRSVAIVPAEQAKGFAEKPRSCTAVHARVPRRIQLSTACSATEFAFRSMHGYANGTSGAAVCLGDRRRMARPLQSRTAPCIMESVVGLVLATG